MRKVNYNTWLMLVDILLVLHLILQILASIFTEVKYWFIPTCILTLIIIILGIRNQTAYMKTKNILLRSKMLIKDSKCKIIGCMLFMIYAFAYSLINFDYKVGMCSLATMAVTIPCWIIYVSESEQSMKLAKSIGAKKVNEESNSKEHIETSDATGDNEDTEIKISYGHDSLDIYFENDDEVDDEDTTLEDTENGKN